MIAGVFMAMAVLTAGLMPVLIAALRARNILDIPNDRSSHNVPTPRGAGWLVMGLPLLALLGLAPFLPPLSPYAPSLYALIGASAVLMALSAFDDTRSLGALPRVLVHVACAAAVVWTLPETITVFAGLPGWADRALIALGLVWMMNLTNFIDGIDGITAVNGVFTCAGLAVAAAAAPFMPLLAALMGGALAGFFIWNRPPAKVFLGDVGSIPLGLWLGFGLVYVASAYGLIPALLMAAYPLLDATHTLFKRAARRERVWQAHREHLYQRAVQTGRPVGVVLLWIAAFNALALAMAGFALTHHSMQLHAIVIVLGGFILLHANLRSPLK